jgi:hypothetical protein
LLLPADSLILLSRESDRQPGEATVRELIALQREGIYQIAICITENSDLLILRHRCHEASQTFLTVSFRRG